MGLGLRGGGCGGIITIHFSMSCFCVSILFQATKSCIQKMYSGGMGGVFHFNMGVRVIGFSLNSHAGWVR